jgi:MFS transporter, MHS family, citrate/tricarballylate:H+ symporter
VNPPVKRRHVAAAVAGNALEFYDFATFALFVGPIGHAFFPSKDHFTELLLALATFGLGFLTRPFGSIVIGRFGDRVGRRPAMILSFSLMGFAILGLSLTPGYDKLGIGAPIMVLLWRGLQGFAVGGEVGATTAFLVESAPPQHRGAYAAWQGASQNISFLSGGLVGLALTYVIGGPALADWGWRVALGVGVIILPIGLALRRSLPETLHHEDPHTEHAPDSAELIHHVPIILMAIAIVSASTVGTYVLNYMTTYAKETLHMATPAALAAQVANGGAGIIFNLIGGALADRVGRRPLLIWPRALFLLAAPAAFLMMTHWRTQASLLAGVAILASFAALPSAALYCATNEAMHRRARAVAFGFAYQISVAVFGGSTQFTIAWLTKVTGDPLAPMWYCMVFAAAGLIAALFIRETLPRREAALS